MCIVRYSVKMWGRASMAAIMILILTYLCTLNIVYAKDTISESGSSDINAENILERATTWLWSQRNKDAGWGNDTHRVLLVLRLSNLSRDDNVAPAAPLELQLSSKQMELEIVLLLWRHREVNFSPVRLARYTLALNAMCTDPRQFHGHDLIGTLQHHEPPTDFEFALTTLAACNAQAHVRKRQIRRLLDIANAAQDHNIDTVAMVILALKCIVQDHRHRNLHHFVRKPSVGLAQQQKLDGSFGDIRTTALVMQALEEVENEPADNWNRSTALAWLTSQQQTDGSFGDVRVTAEALLGIAPRGLASIRTLDCGQGFSETSSPKFTTNESTPVSSNRNDSISIFVISGTNTSNVTTGNNGTNGNNSNSGTNGNNATNTFNTNNTDGVIITSTTPIMVNVSYTLWVGSNVNETYSLIVTAPKNETFYEVMLLAAEMSPHFQFVASEWPNGHYVHTIAGYKEEPMSYHYWLLYRLNSPPDSTSPPGNQLVAPGGVDDLQISEGDHYLFWYKKL
ncbi:uncharacterized protein CG3556 isoform X2 [Apis laboriosa]|uniref:uncharacterized protein CG3556 isoform X2 n=1 Tax=Apis laboriosa TaxID=183418 RepID=UPI001CC5A2C9|nr:uncharacterized protein CG3556 isoform X2 [Apis laboriosa]